MKTQKLQEQRIELFGHEYLVIEPADGFRIAVETGVVRWRLEKALERLADGSSEKAADFIQDALREIDSAENFHQVPMLVRCLTVGAASEDQHGPTMFEMK